jgi:hypothetical protein
MSLLGTTIKVYQLLADKIIMEIVRRNNAIIRNAAEAPNGLEPRRASVAFRARRLFILFN